MQIATSLNLATSYLTDAALLPRLAAAGFDGIDFNFCDRYDEREWHNEKQADAFADRLAAQASDAGLTWVQAHGPMFRMFGDGAEDTRRRELCAPCIRVCGRLGVPWMVLHPETLPGEWDEAHRGEMLRRNVAFFQGLLPLCEAQNLGIAIENMPQGGERGRRYGGTPEDLIKLIDALDHPLIGACWDTGHANISGLEQQAAIGVLGSRLKVTHIQENDGRGDDHMLPFVNGKSGVPWEAVMAGLRDAGYSGAFTYEAHSSFRALPEPLYDDMLRLAVKIARQITRQITNA